MNSTMTEKEKYLGRIYYSACAAGICSTKREFADVLGVDRTGLSAAMNGNPRHLTKNLIEKVERFAKDNGLDDSPKEIRKPEEDNIRENIDYILRIYNLSVLRGLCRTRGEFASLLGVSDKNLSSAIHGNPRNLTRPFLAKVREFASERGLEDEPIPTSTAPEKVAQNGVFLPTETLELYTTMSKSIERLTRIVESLTKADANEGQIKRA